MCLDYLDPPPTIFSMSTWEGQKSRLHLALKNNETVSSIKVTYSDRSFMLVIGTFSNVFLSFLVSIVLQGYLKLPV